MQRYDKYLRQLFWLRMVAILVQSLIILSVVRFLDIPLPVTPLAAIIGGQLLLNLATYARLRLSAAVHAGELFGQLLADILALGGLLYFTGGSANPFTSLFILQVMIAATLLPARYSWLTATAAIALYTALMFWKIEIPYLHHHHLGEYFNLHVHGMWLSFVMLALLTAWFVARMHATIRKQDRLLADAERLASLGMLATGAAHELSTPLATVTVLADEYERQANSEPARQQAATLKTQALRCRDILSRMTLAAGVMRAESGHPMPLDHYLRDLFARWHASRPDITFTAELPDTPAPRIVADYGLEQAIANLLNNAADASPHHVRLRARWSARHLWIEVEDQGKGIPPGILEALDRPAASSKPEGLGMGLYLTRSVAGRLEGGLAFASLHPGTRATLTLPMKRLRI